MVQNKEEYSKQMENMLSALRKKENDPKLSAQARKNFKETADIIEEIRDGLQKLS